VGVLLAAGLWGCASVGTGGPLLPAGGEPWELPGEAYPTQRLFRVKYEGPEGKASFKLTLYLEAAEHYRMAAADGLGRKLWTLDLEAGGRALWFDHREQTWCSTVGERLDFVPLARLPLVALPRLLLGRLPAIPAGAVQRSGDGHFTYSDASGQSWNGSTRDGQLEWWSLGEGDGAVAWWRREEEGGSFVHRDRSQQVRWREVVREPLLGGIEALEIPRGYAERDCGLVARGAR
jgi:hypothetical protein